MNRTIRVALAVVFIVIISICAALSASALLGRRRVDLTEDNLYTLSEGTRNILGKLNRPITAKLYYSRSAAMKGPEQIRYLNKYYLYVRDLLEEYEELSDGMIDLEAIDPGTYTEEEEEALDHGLKQEWIAEDESFFFGLVVRTQTGKEKVIEFFDPSRQDFVEYDITKLISELIRKEKKRVGILSSLPVAGEDMSPYMMRMLQMQGRMPPPWWHIARHLQNRFDAERLDTDVRDISDEFDFLMVVHPKDFPERTLFAIDQYVMNGGKLVVFLDPWCREDQPQQQRQPYGPPPPHDRSSSFDILLEKWGVRMDPELVVTDPALLEKTEVGERVRTPMGTEVQYRPVTFLVLRDESRNQDEVITARLPEIRMLYPGTLEQVPAAETEFAPLLTTTESGNTWNPKQEKEQKEREQAVPRPEPRVTMDDLATGSLRHASETEGEPLVLACRLTGTFETNFPDGIIVHPEDDEEAPPPGEDEDEEEEESEHLEAKQKSEEGAQVVVFADVDFISNWLAYRQTFLGASAVGGNAPLVLNTFDFLGGSTDLISVRAQGEVNRPFLVVEDMKKEIEKATAEREKQLQKKKEEAQERLEKLQKGATEETQALLNKAKIEEIQKWRREFEKARTDLRRLRAENRERIDALKARLQFHNLVWAPAVVLLIGIGLGVARRIKARWYTAKRAGIAGPPPEGAGMAPVGAEQLVLGGVAVVMVVLTATLLSFAKHEPEKSFVRGTPLVQGLDTQDVHTIAIVEKEHTVTLNRTGEGRFVVAEKDDYPADESKINRLIVRDILDITCETVASRNPELHEQFGVTDGHDDAVKISFLDENGEPIIGFIRGKSSDQGGVYVRLLGEDVVYRTETGFWPDTRPIDYIDTSVTDVGKKYIERVRVEIADAEPYVIERDKDNDVRLQAIPEGMRAKEYEPGNVFEALTSLEFSDVFPARELSEMDLEWDATYTADLFTGLRYRLELAEKDDKHYLRIKATWLDSKKDAVQDWMNAPEKKEEKTERADAVVLHQELPPKFNSRHGGWVYQVASYKADDLRKPFDELIEEDLPEKISARHVLIAYKDAEDAPDGVERTKDEAKKLAEKVLAEAKQEGADFARLAETYSDDEETKEKGGDLGEIKADPSDWPEDFWKPAFRLEPGQVAGVLETDKGFHIVQRTDGTEKEEPAEEAEGEEPEEGKPEEPETDD
ncbi:MAG: Gldg family protein [Planctomycetota bacterium]